MIDIKKPVDPKSEPSTWFWQLAELRNYVLDLHRKHDVLKIALIGSAVLNLALVLLVLYLGYMLGQ